MNSRVDDSDDDGVVIASFQYFTFCVFKFIFEAGLSSKHVPVTVQL